MIQSDSYRVCPQVQHAGDVLREIHLGKDQAAANSPADQDAMSADSIFGSDASSWPSE